MEYEDGASTLFLYTKGTAGIPNEEVKQLLHYMEDTTYGNVVNEDLREIHRMVETVKRDQKVVGMHIQMVDDLLRQAEKITKQEKEITKQAEEITELEEKTAKQAEEITKQAEEIRRLQEELEQRKNSRKNK